ncbi:MAG: DedA family protein [Zetaproteobacteria bacterium]|nr:MAG: DedA family protein [Zetaproteobacteria bacterium]
MAEFSDLHRRSYSGLGWLRRCYHWTLGWADHPQAGWALFGIALIEASVFPIPPDVLLIALALGRPDLSIRFASLATAGSVTGAIVGYLIGRLMFASVAEPLLDFYGAMEQFKHTQELFSRWGVALVLIAGFSPIPFKVITIASGAFGLFFPSFLLSALLSRGARFYLEGVLLRWGGDRMRRFVERHFEWMTLLVVILVISGFVALWLWR